MREATNDAPALAAPINLPMRDGSITISALIDHYMAQYAGRDCTRVQRLGWWVRQIGVHRLDEVTDDHLHIALETLADKSARYYAGKDADGLPIYRAKRKPIAPATINRYAASISAVFTWAIRRRVAPKGWDHPGRRIERKPENNDRTRFLSDDERVRLLATCKASKWPRLYLIVLLALTTGARKGELLGLRWCDVDLARQLVHVGRTKNGDPKALPLVPAVVAELERFKPETMGPALVCGKAKAPTLPYAFEGRWHEAMRAAKLRDFCFHALRHSCASLLAQNGATLLEIGDLLGHRQIAMTKRYSHLAAGHRTALVNRVLGDLR
jgi:integrase